MYKDAKEELKRLEEALLEEEEVQEAQEQQEEDDIDALLEETKRLTQEHGDETQVFRWNEQDLLQSARVYNTDKIDEDLNRFAEKVMEEPAKGIKGLTITAIGLAAAVLLVVVVWLIRYGGALR